MQQDRLQSVDRLVIIFIGACHPVTPMSGDYCGEILVTAKLLLLQFTSSVDHPGMFVGNWSGLLKRAHLG